MLFHRHPTSRQAEPEPNYEARYFRTPNDPQQTWTWQVRKDETTYFPAGRSASFPAAKIAALEFIRNQRKADKEGWDAEPAS